METKGIKIVINVRETNYRRRVLADGLRLTVKDERDAATFLHGMMAGFWITGKKTRLEGVVTDENGAEITKCVQ